MSMLNNLRKEKISSNLEIVECDSGISIGLRDMH